MLTTPERMHSLQLDRPCEGVCDSICKLPFASDYSLSLPVGFKGNLSLLEICFPSRLEQMEVNLEARLPKEV